MRLFRLRTLTGSNIAGLLLGRRLLAVLPADAVHAAGAALLGHGDGRRLHHAHARGDRDGERRPGARAPGRRSRGAAGGAADVAGRARPLRSLPVSGHYFWDLFPGSCSAGSAWRSVRAAHDRRARGRSAGRRRVASGLVNTTQQMGGAIGVAAATTIAATRPALPRRASGGGRRGRAHARLQRPPSGCWPRSRRWARSSRRAVVESKPQLADEAAELPAGEPVLEAAA